MQSVGCISRKNVPDREADGAGGGKRPEDLETSAVSVLLKEDAGYALRATNSFTNYATCIAINVTSMTMSRRHRFVTKYCFPVRFGASK